MTQVGVVKKVADGKALVSVIRKGACGENCSMCGACKADPIEVNARCEIAVLAGDLVEISSPDHAIIFAMICLFIFPVFLPIVAFVLFSDWLGAIAGWVSAGLILGLCIALICFLSKNRAFLKAVQPTVKRIVDR